MGTKPHTESVIARLMCLDEQPPQHPVHKQQRVLSENYLLKTASIGLREGSSFAVGHSHRVSSGQMKGIKKTFEVQISKDQHDSLSHNDESAKLSTGKVEKEVLKVFPGSRQRKVEIFCKKSKWHAPRSILNSIQKVDNDSLAGHVGDFGPDHWNDFVKSQLAMLDRFYHSSTKISVLKSTFSEGKNHLKQRRSYLHPIPGYGDLGKPLKAERKRIYNELIDGQKASSDMETPIYSFSAHNRTMNRRFQPSELEVKSETFSNAGNLKEDEAEIITQKDSVEHRGSRDREFQSPLGLDLCNGATISQSISCLGSNNNNPRAYSKGIQDATEKSDEKDNRYGDIEHGPRVPKPSISKDASQCTLDQNLVNTGVSCKIITDKDSDPNPAIVSMIDAEFSDVWEAFSQQELANEFSDEEFHEAFKGINQYSPDSVLSPHEIENSSVSECFESVASDFDSLFESEETHSEDSGMAISSDEVMKKESDDLSRDGRIIQWSFGYEESRDFSYLLDVLDEAGFDSVDLGNFSKTFNSQEDLLCPFVFEALEKKYSKQISWRKSERKLLFDRINCGLREIIAVPFINFNKHTTPVKRRFSTTLNRDEVKDELWQLLISQEKNQDLSQKFLGKEMKWFELEEDVNNIVRELENFLFDELAIELVSRDDE